MHNVPSMYVYICTCTDWAAAGGVCGFSVLQELNMYLVAGRSLQESGQDLPKLRHAVQAVAARLLRGRRSEIRIIEETRGVSMIWGTLYSGSAGFLIVCPQALVIR